MRSGTPRLPTLPRAVASGPPAHGGHAPPRGAGRLAVVAWAAALAIPLAGCSARAAVEPADPRVQEPIGTPGAEAPPAGGAPTGPLRALTPNMPPAAAFVVATPGPIAKSAVRFDASSSTGTDASAVPNLVSWTWTWGDASASQTFATSGAIHAYQTPGTYAVKLVVTNAPGAQDSVTTSVMIAKRDTLAITYVPATPGAGEPITFTAANANSPSGNPGTFLWTFTGFAQNGTGQGASNVPWTFDSAGTRLVRLVGQFPGGPRQLIAQAVTVGVAKAPTGSITCSPASPTAGQSVSCTSSVTPVSGALSTYAWSFAGGSPATASAANASTAWAGPGLYPAQLTATNSYGVSATFTQYLNVPAEMPYVAVGARHACAIDVSTGTRRVLCWGYNTYGETGPGPRGTATLSPAPIGTPLPSTPAAVAAGQGATCLLGTAGDASCLGSNGVGRAGVPFPPDSVTTFSAVAGGHTFASVVTSVANNNAPAGFSCGLRLDARLYCWGWNSVGQVGNGGAATTYVPSAVSGGRTWAMVSAGAHVACGLDVTGVAYCWGWNFAGQLGNGSHTDANVPTVVAGGRRYSTIAVGGQSACAVAVTGTLYCWGSAQSGVAGPVSGTDVVLPRAVATPARFAQLVVGGSHACGLTAAGQAYCWGQSSEGQTGAAPYSFTRSTIVAVDGGLTFTRLTASSNHTCGQTTAHEVWCWGENVDGTVGDGTTTNRLAPVRVAGLVTP